MRPPSRPSAHSGAPTLAFSLGRAPQGHEPQFIFPTVPQALLSRGIKTMLMTADTGQGLLKGHTPTGMHGGFAGLRRPLSLRVCLRLRCPISRARPCPGARGPRHEEPGPCSRPRISLLASGPGAQRRHLCRCSGPGPNLRERAGFQRKSCPRPAPGARGAESPGIKATRKRQESYRGKHGWAHRTEEGSRERAGERCCGLL